MSEKSEKNSEIKKIVDNMIKEEVSLAVFDSLRWFIRQKVRKVVDYDNFLKLYLAHFKISDEDIQRKIEEEADKAQGEPPGVYIGKIVEHTPPNMTEPVPGIDLYGDPGTILLSTNDTIYIEGDQYDMGSDGFKLNDDTENTHTEAKGGDTVWDLDLKFAGQSNGNKMVVTKGDEVRRDNSKTPPQTPPPPPPV